jgi:GNAT superfamily N-acetyltransferase
MAIRIESSAGGADVDMSARLSQPELLSDISLSRRLEGTEALANARFVEARARLSPDSAAQWIEVAGAYAMYDGPRSPCTQTFGLGLFQMPTAADMDTLEAFFKDRAAPVLHEVSPLADKALLPLLSERGYRPIELTSVMFQPLSGRLPSATAIDSRPISANECDLWARTTAEGWREFADTAGLMLDLGRVVAASQGTIPFLAELEGQPIAAGAICLHHGVALLSGASTIPEWRHRGAQRALLESRLAYAARAGCDLAMMCAEPGSASQRNAEREGFRIAYTRIKWSLLSA